jgi:hypothetical protein
MWDVGTPKCLHCKAHGNIRGPVDSGLIGEMCFGAGRSRGCYLIEMHVKRAGLESLLDENTPHRRSRRGYQRSVKSRLALVEVEIRDLALRLGRGTWVQCRKYTKIDTTLLVTVQYPSVHAVADNNLLRPVIEINILFSSRFNRVQMSRLRSGKQT